MNTREKESLLEGLKAHITYIQAKLAQMIERTRGVHSKSMADMRKMEKEERMMHMSLRDAAEEDIAKYEKMEQSPFFMKCEIEFKDNKNRATLYFAKSGFIQEKIYSWIAPVATIRFESLGDVSYSLPDGKRRVATMLSKDQYMIVDGKVLFYATESLEHPRELVHQEHISRKSGFILPDVVAQMEKAQDAVIRAHHEGPFVITGPAGSGKTTLALHRVAYLAQSPDTAHFYPGGKTIVFVQDSGTQAYFSHLLPELGITNVTITTFGEWAISILGLYTYKFERRSCELDSEQDLYEFAKLKALRQAKFPKFSGAGDACDALRGCYTKHFTETQKKMFEAQVTEHKLDRFDLTILLLALIQTKNKFEVTLESMNSYHGKAIKSKKVKREVKYASIVVDEFQNYMPEQLHILQKCIEPERRSVLYVGDMAQQIQLGTIQNWDDLGVTITTERQAKLEKVYRNTKNILDYIAGLGFMVSIPEQLRVGASVVEKIFSDKQAELEYVEELIKANKEGTVGVLAKDSVYLEDYKDKFAGQERVRVLTMVEAQGVEFETVCIVGVYQKMFSDEKTSELPEELRVSKRRIDKDLLYVALTRAMNELYVLGECSLKDAIKI